MISGPGAPSGRLIRNGRLRPKENQMRIKGKIKGKSTTNQMKIKGKSKKNQRKNQRKIKRKSMQNQWKIKEKSKENQRKNQGNQRKINGRYRDVGSRGTSRTVNSQRTVRGFRSHGHLADANSNGRLKLLGSTHKNPDSSRVSIPEHEPMATAMSTFGA